MNLTYEFRAAMRKHLDLVDQLGANHPETIRAMMLSLELAPDEIKDEMSAMAAEMDLIPEASGYLDDGTPMYSLNDMAEKMGISIDEAEKRLQAFMADRETIGLSNAGIVTDSTLIHRMQ